MVRGTQRAPALVLVLLAACSGSQVIAVRPDGVAQSGTSRAAADPTFEVVARIAGLKDPMPVTGSSVAFSDLETALDQAVLRAVPPRHDSTLTIELVSGDAVYKHTRLAVTLVARAVLRAHQGDAFVAQKLVVCRDGAIVEPELGSRVIWSCMTRLGQDLGGWLEGLPP